MNATHGKSSGWPSSQATTKRAGRAVGGVFAFAQFKRSALPNGPKVSAGGALSPRGEWRAPSDGNAEAWLAELERNVPKG